MESLLRGGSLGLDVHLFTKPGVFKWPRDSRPLTLKHVLPAARRLSVSACNYPKPESTCGGIATSGAPTSGLIEPTYSGAVKTPVISVKGNVCLASPSLYLSIYPSCSLLLLLRHVWLKLQSFHSEVTHVWRMHFFLSLLAFFFFFFQLSHRLSITLLNRYLSESIPFFFQVSCGVALSCASFDRFVLKHFFFLFCFLLQELQPCTLTDCNTGLFFFLQKRLSDRSRRQEMDGR